MKLSNWYNSVPIKSSIRNYLASWLDAWDVFWFRPRSPQVISGLRIFTGLMLLYSHLVLATDLTSFLGDTAWIDNETARQLHAGGYGEAEWGRSYLWHFSDPAVLWCHHLFTIVVTVCFMAGLLTRVTAPLAWFLQLMYLHRLTGALFGFDQIVTYCTMYLMLSPCGSLLSVDAWIRRRYADSMAGNRWFGLLFPDSNPSVAANIATRLLQIHLCAIYFFGGLAKARGTSWWDGTAIWYSVANLEYQSTDMTWLIHYPRICSLMSHLAMFWEITYIALVWPRITRPIVIAMAIAMHGGIALCLGMITFGIMMIGANLIFLPVHWFDRSRLFDEAGGLRDEEAALLDYDDDEMDEVEIDDLEDLALAGLSEDEDEGEGENEGDDKNEDEEGLTDSSLSGLLSNESALPDVQDDPQLVELRQKLKKVIRKREKRLQHAYQKIKQKAKKLKSRETKYRESVKRLKSREAKIKSLVERSRARRQQRSEKPEDSSDQEDS